MNYRTYHITACALLVAALLLLWPDLASYALAGPLDSIASKGNDARDQLITVGKAFIGVVTVALFIMAAAGKVPWMWVGMVIIAGAGLTAVPTIQSWLNQ
ncbi:MAG: hypothetical protein JWL84_1268 [Rhodospirillales bacterium]|jgi:hypothetical protein|nr:hypothetical protein [Rhodospirillales bacterium]